MIQLAYTLLAIAAQDAGPDAGPPLPVRQEGESCDPDLVDDTCAAGLECLIEEIPQLAARCRKPCLDDNPDCPESRTCQTVRDWHTLDPVGAWCLPRTLVRDERCRAHEDPDACAGGLVCTRTVDRFDYPPGGFRCKLRCPNGEQDCPVDEDCSTTASVAQVLELDDAGARRECTLERCPGAACECSPGSDCIDEDGSPVCGQRPPACGISKRNVRPTDFGTSAFSAEAGCNAADDHRHCNPPLALDDGAAVSQCFLLGDFYEPWNGVCIQPCEQPPVDVNGNGVIDATFAEQGWQRACPSGYVCERAIGRALILGAIADNPVSPDGKRHCDYWRCVEGETCPAECGEGDVECIATGLGFDGVCMAPLGSCVPAPVTDAGDADASAPDGLDSGGEPDDVDAGTSLADASTPSDAGEWPDAAAQPADAGSLPLPDASAPMDAGAELPDDCSCASASSRRAEGRAGLLAALLLLSLFSSRVRGAGDRARAGDPD